MTKKDSEFKEREFYRWELIRLALKHLPPKYAWRVARNISNSTRQLIFFHRAYYGWVDTGRKKHLIGHSFRWPDTPEGREFWSKVFEEKLYERE